MTDAEVLELTTSIAATPEIVFPYFTDPVRYILWMGIEATLETVPGGLYHVKIRDDMQANGKFIEITPPHRLVFTWGYTANGETVPDRSRVEITLEPEGTGTKVTLRHFGLSTLEERQHHQEGWEMYLSRLRLVANGGNAGPEPFA